MTQGLAVGKKAIKQLFTTKTITLFVLTDIIKSGYNTESDLPAAYMND